MAVDAMRETRRRGDSKRLETILGLVDAVRKSPARRQKLIETAVASASGLNAENSRKTFRSECNTAVHPDVVANFDAILALADRIWTERKLEVHSKYHLVLRLCKLVSGGRRSDAYSFPFIEKCYIEEGRFPL